MTDTHDPYTPPESSSSAPLDRYQAIGVSRGRRFANYILDLIVFSLLLIPVFFLAIVLFGEQSVVQFEALFTIGERFSINVLNLVLYILYYFIFEASIGRTPAKFITRTRVVRPTGERSSITSILLRTLIRFIPFEPFSVLLSDDQNIRGWHDRWTDTVVVSAVEHGNAVNGTSSN